MSGSIMSLFSGLLGNKAAQPASPVTVEGNTVVTEPANNAATIQAGTPNPSAFNSAPTDKSQQSPLAPYENLWQAPANDSKNQPPSLVPAFKLDQEKLAATVSKMDFTQGISPDLLTKAMSGNDPASLVAVMNTMVQQAFSQGLAAQTGMLTSAFTHHADVLNNHVLPNTVSTLIRQKGTEMPDYMQNPAIQPLAGAVNEMFARQHPNATPAQIAAHTREYLKTIGMEVLRNEGMQVSPASKNELPGMGPQPTVDWGSWLTR